jgi:hypothetical protein
VEVVKDGGREVRRSKDVRVVIVAATAASDLVVAVAGTFSCFRS